MNSITKIKVKHKGMSSEHYLNTMSKIFSKKELEDIAEKSLTDFVIASPNSDIGSGWSYDITQNGNKNIIVFNNSSIKDGTNIAIILDTGYATVTGKWVQGYNYLKEPIKKIYKRINELLSEAR